MEENTRSCGAMSKLISDCAQYEVRNRAQSIFWELFIDDWQGEPHYPHQNFSERCYQTVKRLNNSIIYRTGAHAYMWLISLVYVWFLLNHTHYAVTNGMPINKAKVYTADISLLLCFRFWWTSILQGRWLIFTVTNH